MYIKSFGFDQEHILKDILTLHIPEKEFHADVTYGYGGFYRNIRRPKHCFDKNPRFPFVIKSDAENLPLLNNSLNSLVFDAPFIITDHKHSEHYLMFKRYSGFRIISEMRDMYEGSIKEAQRVLRPGGVLIIKCQDYTHGKKNYLFHNEILNWCHGYGFYDLDMFVLLAKQRFHGFILHQRTARKFHSYFLVLKKRTRRSSISFSL